MLRHLPAAALLILGPAPLAEASAAPAAQRSGQCSIDALPAPQRKRLVDGYVARHKAQGKASADAWAKAQEDAIYKQLVAQGACPADRGPAQAAKAPPRKPGKTILDKQGKPCRNIAVENQVFPGFGGEPMRMALVQVCKD